MAVTWGYMKQPRCNSIFTIKVSFTLVRQGTRVTVYVMRKWREGTTLAEALAGEMVRRKRPGDKDRLPIEVVAREMKTSGAQVSRYLNGALPTKEPRLAQALIDWLGTDVAGFGQLAGYTMLRQDE